MKSYLGHWISWVKFVLWVGNISRDYSPYKVLSLSKRNKSPTSKKDSLKSLKSTMIPLSFLQSSSTNISGSFICKTTQTPGILHHFQSWNPNPDPYNLFQKKLIALVAYKLELLQTSFSINYIHFEVHLSVTLKKCIKKRRFV
jgi:hypothetical protein